MTTDAARVTPYRSPFAGLRVRLLAAAADAALLVAAGAAIAAATGGALSVRTPLAVTVVAAVYLGALWSTTGWTLGQRLLGLRVVRAADGTAIGAGAAATRVVGCLVAVLPLFLGVLWCGWDSRKQGWQDKVAGTVVIHDR